MKGNVLVGQSGGPTAAINSSLAGVYCTAKELGADKVYGMRYGIEGLIEGKYIDLSEHLENELDVETLKRTPSAYLGSCRYKLPKVEDNKEVYDKIFEIIDKLNIEVFIYIGGNDSMDTISKLSAYAAEIGHAARFIGCPKTIDNDLALTDHTPGFGSAAKYIATSVKEVICDNNCLQYGKGLVTIIEVMGRNAGWLTGSAALCQGEDCEGPDMIYLPEITFDMEKFLAKVKGLLAEKSSVVVVVSEGIKLADGRYVCELGSNTDFVDAFGHKQLSGTASYLAGFIGGSLGCKTRAIEFSTLQRAGSHMSSKADIEEAFQAGSAAVSAGVQGESAKMVVFERISETPYLCGTGLRDVHKIANDEKVVPREWVNEEGTYVTEEFAAYARPLIQGEVIPVMVNGVPRHLNKAR